MKKVIQNTVIPNITKKRNYVKKTVEPEVISLPSDVENENNIQKVRECNLIKAREARQVNLNIKESNKEQKINELVEAISNEQIEKIKVKNQKLKDKLLKLI
jgi:hypothetical protein